MSWAVGYDDRWQRWIGYGVPSVCDYPGCNEEIDRGLGYVCGGEPFGGDDGCGLFFCPDHKRHRLCRRCQDSADPYIPTPDTPQWVNHMLTDESWTGWRESNPDQVAEMTARIADPDDADVEPDGCFCDIENDGHGAWCPYAEGVERR